MALNSQIQTYQNLTNDGEVGIPSSISNILMAVTQLSWLILSYLQRFTERTICVNLTKSVVVFGFIGDKICWSDKKQPL